MGHPLWWPFELVFDEVGDDFGVGFADEAVASADEFVLQRDVVFHDAVVHHDEGAAAVAVRVRVLFGGAAVGGPACVADAVGAMQRVLLQHLLEVAQLAGCAAHVELRGVGLVARDGNAGGVVAAVLEAAKAFNDKGDD